MAGIRSGLAAAAVLVLLALPVPIWAQGVAFQAVPGTLLEGPVLNVTPSVSVDRRYVRLGINPQFIGNVGFNTFMVPAAVGGGPGGPGALGGLGAGGGQFLAGMNGVMDPWQGSGSGGFAPGFGFMGDPLLAQARPPVVAAAPVAQPARRIAAPKTRTSKALQSGRNTRTNKAKHPATAAAPGSIPGSR